MELGITHCFDNYKMEDTIKAELNNNLTIVNAILERQKLKIKPEFYILGGAALVFHDLDYKSTLDIDTANRIYSEVRDLVSDFIDDAASEVSVLAFNYKSRAKLIREDLTSMNTFILSEEDLCISKLLSGRRKDYNSVVNCGILKRIKYDTMMQIATTELEKDSREALITILGRLMRQ